MNRNTVQLVRSITAIFWLGFFMAISFMEAPLKFTAPNLSMAEGLQIGKIIFGALNVCEWVFLIIILITCFINKTSKTGFYLVASLSVILLLETVWLLPVLDSGADKIIHGQPFDHHGLHWAYVIFEIIKAPVLLLIGLDSRKMTRILKPVS